jgi:hypothetical protein
MSSIGRSTVEGRRRRPRRPSPSISHAWPAWAKRKVAACCALLALASATAWGDASARGWPSFLPPRDSLSPDLVTAVERTWAHRTLSRTVRGPSARVPFDLYTALLDAPDVTAAAARYRHFSRDEVRLVGHDLYEADDHNGSRGFYLVLTRERDRRVLFSWGENSTRILGTISGDALTVLTLEPGDGRIDQAVTAYVRIDNGFVAALARALLTAFGGMADRKLRQGVVTATRVAEWAASRPEEFCGWLDRSGLPPARRDRVRSLVAGCA